MTPDASETEILKERLKNWGRWCADRRRCDTNVIYRLMKLYGEMPKLALEEEYRPPIDVRDALVVNAAWQSLPNRPAKYAKMKRILAVEYTVPESIPLHPICRALRIPQSEYKELLKTGLYMMFFRLIPHACKKIQML